MGKPYVQSTDPSLTHAMSQNDLWLNISEGTMKAWDGTGWVEMQFGESAIMDDCITNRMLANDISASKITAGILQSSDGSFYLNLETGEAELLNLVLGGQIEGNVVATATNGETRVRLRGREGDKTVGLIFEHVAESEGETDWENRGQIYPRYSDGRSVCTMDIYEIGPYRSSRPIMGYNSGASDGLMWRMISQDWLKAGYYTYHGARLARRETLEDSFTNITPVMTANGKIMSGTALAGTGVVTCTHKFNDVMQIDFQLKITTAGSGTGTYGILTSLIRTINTEIPPITPQNGGVLNIFTSSGALSTTHIGTTFLADGDYWTPARHLSGVITKIDESFFTANMFMSGTVYATYSYED